MPRCAWFGGVVSFELSYNSKNGNTIRCSRSLLYVD